MKKTYYLMQGKKIGNKLLPGGLLTAKDSDLELKESSLKVLKDSLPYLEAKKIIFSGKKEVIEETCGDDTENIDQKRLDAEKAEQKRLEKEKFDAEFKELEDSENGEESEDSENGEDWSTEEEK